jgi:hypothetical protein
MKSILILKSYDSEKACCKQPFVASPKKGYTVFALPNSAAIMIVTMSAIGSLSSLGHMIIAREK